MMVNNVVDQPLPAGAKNQTPKRIVVHAMGQYIRDTHTSIEYSAVDFLKKERLSAHALIDPAGMVIRCREDTQGAYHASGFNTDSLGVEFLVYGVHDWESFKKEIQTNYVNPNQYYAGVDLVKHWIKTFNIIQLDRHSDLSPDRKKDPGSGFHWDQFRRDVGL